MPTVPSLNSIPEGWGATEDSNAFGSPMDQARLAHDSAKTAANKMLAVSLGKHQSGGGRTVNIPKTSPINTVPDHSYNGGLTIGEPCVGGHCSIPVTPLASNLIHNNLSSANPPPGANLNYTGNVRLGNNHIDMPGIPTTPGPFDIQCMKGGGRNAFSALRDPRSGESVSTTSARGRTILARYLRRLGY